MTRMRLVLAVLLAMLVVLLSCSTASAATQGTGIPSSAFVGLPAALAIGPDCKGDPPAPLSPYGLFATKPAVTSTADPFSTANTSIQSVYGTNFGWWTYDNGCAAGSDILPSLATNISNLIGFQIPGLAPNWGQALMGAVVNPTWTDQLDSVVQTTAASTASGVWFPWLAVTLMVVAVITLTRAMRGALPALVTGLVWSLLVLVVVSWTVNYPTESTKLLDSGIQTAVVSTAAGFSGGTGTGASSQSTAQQAQLALDQQWDDMVRGTLYRSWLQGAFGSPDSKTATTYGPALFKSTHFSWAEYDIYTADPGGQGKAIVTAKADAFRQVADQIQTSDPVAYQSFTGNNYWDRMGIAFLSLVETIVVAWFLLAAAAIILMAYLLIRLVIPIAPAAGVFFMVEPLRDMALGWLRKIAGLLVMGPLFFMAALVVGKFNSAIMASSLNMTLKLVFVGGIAVLAWKLLRPQSMVGRLKVPGLAALGGFLGSRKGASDAATAVTKTSDKPSEVEAKNGPVHVGSSVATRTGPPIFNESAKDEPIVYTATSTSSARPSAQTRPGTFAPRSVEGGGSAVSEDRQLSPRTLRTLSAVPAGASGRGALMLSTAGQVAADSTSDHAQVDGERLQSDMAPETGTRNALGRTPAPEGGATGAVDGRASSGALAEQTTMPASATVLGGAVVTDPMPANVHPANMTLDQNGVPIFEVYRPEQDVVSHGGVVYGA